MKSFEREVREFLNGKKVNYVDNSASYTDPDFTVHGRGSHVAQIEVKEKRQTYSTTNWPIPFGEHNAFILDELTARKLMRYPENGCLFVRDNTTGLYYFLDTLALWLAPRFRCNREMDKGHLKGKWIMDFRDFMGSDNLQDLFVFMRDYLKEAPGIFAREHVECYFGTQPTVFFNEDPIEVYGTKRTLEQKEHDVQETR